MFSFRHKKTGARPVTKSGGSLGMEANLAAVEVDIGGMWGTIKRNQQFLDNHLYATKMCQRI